MKKIVISLYDPAAKIVRPWANAGYICHCYDLKHAPEGRIEKVEGGGEIHFLHMDLWNQGSIMSLTEHRGRVAMLFARPVMTDLKLSGQSEWARKFKADPMFQIKAQQRARWCDDLGLALQCPYMIISEPSRLYSFWRRFDAQIGKFQIWGGGDVKVPANFSIPVAEAIYSVNS